MTRDDFIAWCYLTSATVDNTGVSKWAVWRDDDRLQSWYLSCRVSLQQDYVEVFNGKGETLGVFTHYVPAQMCITKELTHDH